MYIIVHPSQKSVQFPSFQSKFFICSLQVHHTKSRLGDDLVRKPRNPWGKPPEKHRIFNPSLHHSSTTQLHIPTSNNHHIHQELDYGKSCHYFPNQEFALPKIGVLVSNLSSRVEKFRHLLGTCPLSFSSPRSCPTCPAYATLSTVDGHRPLAPNDTKATCSGVMPEIELEISEPERMKPLEVSRAQPPGPIGTWGMRMTDYSATMIMVILYCRGFFAYILIVSITSWF